MVQLTPQRLVPLLSLFTTLTLAGPILPSECAEGAYIVIVRDFFEEYGKSQLYDVAKMISQSIPGSYIAETPYNPINPANDAFLQQPGTVQGAYTNSRVVGRNRLGMMITGYRANCIQDPATQKKMIILGAGSGAHVVADLLDADDGTLSMGVSSVLVFGDPTRQMDKAYNLGSGVMDGLFYRPEPPNSNSTLEYDKVMRSYCDYGDPYCDQGDNLDVHKATVPKYAKSAAMFANSTYLIGNPQS